MISLAEFTQDLLALRHLPRAMPATHEQYASTLESAARRNCMKAERLGYRFQLILLDDFLSDIGAIREFGGGKCQKRCCRAT